MDVYLSEVFGWVFLAAIFLAIPILTMVCHERRYRREVRRRLAEMHRIHEYREASFLLDGHADIYIPPRPAPEAFRPSKQNGE